MLAGSVDKIFLIIYFGLLFFHWNKEKYVNLHQKFLVVNIILSVFLICLGDTIIWHCFGINFSRLFFYHIGFISTPLCFSVAKKYLQLIKTGHLGQE